MSESVAVTGTIRRVLDKAMCLQAPALAPHADLLLSVTWEMLDRGNRERNKAYRVLALLDGNILAASAEKLIGALKIEYANSKSRKLLLALLRKLPEEEVEVDSEDSSSDDDDDGDE